MASEQHFCERHGRPAVASRVRIRPDGTRETEYLCEHRPRRGADVERGLGGRGFFDDFFSDFFGEAPPAGGRLAAARAAPGRAGRRDPVLQRRDARAPAARGADRARVGQPRPRQRPPALRRAAGRRRPPRPRPARRRPRGDRGAARGGGRDRASSTDVAPSLSPDAKAALIAAYEESRELGRVVRGPGARAARARARRRDRGGPAARSGSASRTRSCAAP